MASPVRFEHVWKKFRGGERHDSLRDLIPATIGRLARRSKTQDLAGTEFWALEDVSFEVPRGGALGIIGPNGGGKSTTLKLLTRILRPNRGTSVVSGRVGALIEVAAGFHPDLTGRENVYLQGAVMGMKRHEVERRFDDIIEFAGVSAFIDTPIKRYSSGMNARLGFSIAAHLEPDVLIIDEVLSVGDIAFQERCIARMRDFKRQGATIVFVSHNLQAILELCDSAVYLKRQVQAAGAVSDVVDTYVRSTMQSAHNLVDRTDVAVVSTSLVAADGAPVSGPITSVGALAFRTTFRTSEPMQDLLFAFRVLRATDQLLVYDGQFRQEELQLEVRGGSTFSVTFRFLPNLTRGQYYIELLVSHASTQHYLVRLTPAAHLTVAESRTWGGVANLLADAVAERDKAAP